MSSETEEFDRLIGDQLVTLGRSFDDLYTQGRIKLTIDGQDLEMNRIILAYDAMDRRVPPRRATIYDAVNELYLKSAADGPQPSEAVDSAAAMVGVNRPVPVLCHREHMRPAAVCRVCMVELKGFPRLVAACHQPIEPGMVVSTIRTSVRVQKSVRMVHRVAARRPSQSRGRLAAIRRRRTEGFAETARSGRVANRGVDDRPRAGRFVACHLRRSQRLHPLRSLRAGMQRCQGERRPGADEQGLWRPDRFRSE